MLNTKSKTVDSPESHRVILIPEETTFYSSDNAYTSIKTHPFQKKGPNTWKQIMKCFSGPSVYSKLVVKDIRSWYLTIFIQLLKCMDLIY